MSFMAVEMNVLQRRKSSHVSELQLLLHSVSHRKETPSYRCSVCVLLPSFPITDLVLFSCVSVWACALSGGALTTIEPPLWHPQTGNSIKNRSVMKTTFSLSLCN